MEQLLDSILAVAKLAAADAGALMRAHVGRVAVEHEKGAEPRDLVTLVDAACQAAIAARVSSAFPLHSFLGEEDIEAGSAASAAAIRLKEAEEWLWICDPIDGTTNFVSGVPFSCVSIGVAYFGVIQCGVILDPYREEMFFSVRNRGAWLASGTQPPRRLSVSTETLMRNALFAYGLHHSKSVAHTMLRGVQAVTDVSRGARSLGSAALHMAYVAAGRFEAFWELDLNSWDIAAGSLLVTEAGGRVSDMRGEAFTLLTRDVLASNGAPAIHDGTVTALAAVAADRLE